MTESELQAWGRELGRRATAEGIFVCLYGELGAGKSTLVRAACRGVGIEGPVPSPTFTFVHEHRSPGGAVIFHADLYRLRDASELADIGWAELLETDRAVFVEWAERAAPYLPPDRWEVRLGFLSDSAYRSVEASAVGHAPEPPRSGTPEG
jgi:tRNA threonylcarbamoyladenosine biosynthesis protein TsaE